MRLDESTFVPISCLIFRRPGYLASKITSAIMTHDSVHENYRIGMC